MTRRPWWGSGWAVVALTGSLAAQAAGTATGKGTIDNQGTPVPFVPHYASAYVQNFNTLRFTWVVLTEKPLPAGMLAGTANRTEALRQWCEKEKTPFAALQLDAQSAVNQYRHLPGERRAEHGNAEHHQRPREHRAKDRGARCDTRQGLPEDRERRVSGSRRHPGVLHGDGHVHVRRPVREVRPAPPAAGRHVRDVSVGGGWATARLRRAQPKRRALLARRPQPPDDAADPARRGEDAPQRDGASDPIPRERREAG